MDDRQFVGVTLSGFPTADSSPRIQVVRLRGMEIKFHPDLREIVKVNNSDKGAVLAVLFTHVSLTFPKLSTVCVPSSYSVSGVNSMTLK